MAALNQTCRIERSDLLQTPIFWAIHYYLLIVSDEQDSSELVEPFFGLSSDYVNSFFLEQFNRTPSPYFRIAMPEGFAVEVEYAEEIRYIVDHDTWEEPVVLGYDCGNFALPALRWPEVVQIDACIRKTATNAVHRRAGLLLFFPGAYITKGDDPTEVRNRLCNAWRQLGVASAESIPRLVDNTVSYRTIDTSWWLDSQLGYVNDSRYSLRNPRTLMCPFDASRFSRICEFQGMLGRH